MKTQVKARCRELGISQAELSRRTKLHYTTVCQICNGRLIPTPSQRTLIAEALETSPEELWPVSSKYHRQ